MKEVKVGDLLTSLSILISAGAFLRSWAKDREVKKRELADRTRNAASKALGKLERWQELSIWLFQYTQPLFIETSEILVKEFNVIAARDYLWRKLNEARMNIAGKILNEEIEGAYVELCTCYPEIFPFFVKTMKQLKRDEETVFNDFLKSTQLSVTRIQQRSATNDSDKNTSFGDL